MNFYKEQVLTVLLPHLLLRPPSSLGSSDVVFLFGWGQERVLTAGRATMENPGYFRPLGFLQVQG